MQVEKRKAMNVVRALIDESDSARRWAAAWKRAAKRQRAQLHTAATIAAKSITEHARCKKELDEARKRIAALEAGRRLLAQALVTTGDTPWANVKAAMRLAESIVEEDGDE